MTVRAVQELDLLLVQMPGFFVSMAYSMLPSLDLLSSLIAAQTFPTPMEEEKVSEEEEELEIEIGSEEESEVGAEGQEDTDEDVQTEDRTIIFK